MALAFRAAITGVSSGSCCNFNAVVTKPTGTVDGDIIKVTLNVHQSCCGIPTSITPPAGWTTEDDNGYTTNTRGAVYTKKASGEPASWNFAINPAGAVTTTTAEWGAESYSGADQTTYHDAPTVAQTNTSSTNLTAPTQTTATNGAMSLNDYLYNGTGTITDAAGTTPRINRQNANGSVYSAEKLIPTAGTVIGTRVATIVGAKVSRGVTIVLRPAGVATPKTGFFNFFLN